MAFVGNNTMPQEDTSNLMPSGFYDSAASRDNEVNENPRDDVALFAPIKEDLDNLDEAALSSRQRFVAENTGKRLGARSLFWPPPNTAGATSYGQCGRTKDESDILDKATRRAFIDTNE
jgi:hypothetical protein